MILKNITLLNEHGELITLRSIMNGAFVVGESENYIYVDFTNDGEENGSKFYPYNTIMEAMLSAQSGDSILVAGGEYRESILMKEGISLIGSGVSVTQIVLSEENDAVRFENIQNALLTGFTIKSDNFPFWPFFICKASSPQIRKNKIAGYIGSN